MASQNNTGFTIGQSVGIFGGGLSSAGTGNDCQGYGGYMSDSNFQVPFTAVASTGVFTVNSAFNPYLVNTVTTAGNQVGTVVTIGYASQTYTYTVTAANPAVFTAVAASEDLNDLVGGSGVTLIANGTPVVLYGTPISGFTASVPWSANGAYSPSVSQTVYYMVNISGNTFQLATTLGGSGVSSASGTAITAYSASSTFQVVGSAYSSSAGFSPQVPYYMVGVSGSTFQLATTAGGSALTGTGTLAGILQFDLGNQQVSSTVGANQIAYGTGFSAAHANNVRSNGYRYGALDSATTGPLLSLDENPQLAWQNVPGATSQTTYGTSLTGSGGLGGNFGMGWGASGGFLSGQPVYEVKAPAILTEPVGDEKSAPETADHRRVRLTQELNELKAKGSRSAKENARLSVVENALNDLK